MGKNEITYESNYHEDSLGSDCPDDYRRSDGADELQRDTDDNDDLIERQARWYDDYHPIEDDWVVRRFEEAVVLRTNR